MTIPLTEEQKKVVSHRGSPLRVVAGPGTGKTSCLVARIIDLLTRDRVESHSILAVTFTRAAAGEMRERLEKEGIFADRIPDVRTLHSKAVGLLRKHCVRMDLPPKLRPLSESELKLVIQDAWTDLNVLGLNIPFKGKGTIGDYLKAYRSELSGAGVARWISKNNSGRPRVYKKFVQAYEELQGFYGALDWFRVIPLTLRLFDLYPEVLEVEQTTTNHLLVDEYQDLNRTDQELIRRLVVSPSGLCIVGDEDQSIYESQRFAHPMGLVDFEKQFVGTTTLPISQCHRCPQKVVKKANALIANNQLRIPHKTPLQSASNDEGVVATFYRKSKKAEISWLVEKVTDLHQKGFRYKDIMILFGDGKTAEDYIRALRSADIPLDVQLRVAGPFDSVCFINLLAMLYFYADQADNLAVRQCLGQWSNIGAKTIKELRRIAAASSVSLWEAVCGVATRPDSYRSVARRKSVKEFHLAMDAFLKVTEFEKTVETILQHMPECGDDIGVKIMDEYMLKQKGKETVMKLEEVLQNFERERDAGMFEAKEEERPDRVRVMTMHRAKGLQARIVIIPALEDDLIPGNAENIEERRRLFYVSITRAEKALLLSWTSQRIGQEIHRRGGRMLGKRKSRFLDEMGE